MVFVPLAFIQGLVGSFFLPFALTVSFALVASLFVALTAVPVLGALLLRPGDMTDEATDADAGAERNTWMQRAYTPVLAWALRHKVATLAIGVAVTVGSLGLVAIIPVTLFPSGGERFLLLEVSLPPGASPERTFAEVREIEDALAAKKGSVDLYQTTIGTPANPFGPGSAGSFASAASIFVWLKDGAGQPDFGTMNIKYVPDRSCVELKSLKLYLQGYRNEGIFYEAVTNRILDDLVKACAPRRMILTSEWTPRGGISSTVTCQYP